MERSNRNLWIGIGILALVALLALPAWGGGMWLGGPGAFGARPFVGAWSLWTAGLLVRLVFFGLLVFLAVRLLRGRRFGYRGYDRGDYREDYLSVPPAEILRRRYAAGEISREQYEDMRRTLEAEPTTT